MLAGCAKESGICHFLFSSFFFSPLFWGDLAYFGEGLSEGIEGSGEVFRLVYHLDLCLGL